VVGSPDEDEKAPPADRELVVAEALGANPAGELP
jgi:hypothetical protein